MNNKAYIEASCLMLVGCAGFGLLWKQARHSEALLILTAALAAAGALLYLPVQQRKQKEKEYRQCLRADYSDMVTLLCLYMTAGLSLRNSWDELILSYEEERGKGGPERPVYEEMKKTANDIRGGMFEDRAYSRFGLRCQTAEYLRLGGLLESYVRQGNRELLKQLEQEASASIDSAIGEVRRKGERAGAKLLIPIILLFALTLILVTVPAMMSLQAGF